MKKSNLLAVLIFLITIYTADAQSSWTILPTGTDASLYGVDFYDDKIGIAVGDNGTIISTNDGGFTWEQMNSGVDNRLNSVNYIDQDQIIVVGNNGLILSSKDRGVTWSKVIPGTAGEADLLSVDMSQSGKGVIGGASLTLLGTQDNGETWITISKEGEGSFSSVKILDEVTAFAFGENSRSNHIIGRISNCRNMVISDEYQVFNERNYSQGKIVDGYPVSADSILTVGIMYDHSGREQMSYIARSEQWVTNLWLPVIYSNSSFYTGLDIRGNYALAVGGRFNAGSSGEKGYLISESFDKGSTWKDATSPAGPYVLNDVDLQEHTAYIAGDCGIVMKAVFCSLTESLHSNIGLNVSGNVSQDEAASLRQSF